MKQGIIFLVFSSLLALNSRAQPGSLNTNFGNNGIVTETGFAGILASAIKANGNILVGGAGGIDNTDGFLIESYLPNGWLDSSFGINGRAFADLGLSEEIHKIIIQPDGKILTAGYSYRNIFTGGEYPEPNYNIALARFMPDGILDTSFGENGKIETDFGDIEQANSMVLQKDGKIVVGGNAAVFHATGSYDKFLLVRYLSNGKLDSSFGNNGQTRTSFYTSGVQKINGLCLLPNGEIIAGGTVNKNSYGGMNGQLALAKYNISGILDTTFGEAGKVMTEFGPNDETIDDIALQGDGKILATGWAVLPRLGFNRKMIIIRYLSTGEVDETFGVLGKVNIKFNEEIVSLGQSLALQTNGKIVIGGTVLTRQSIGGEFALARCLPNGNLDSSFGINGTVITDIKEEDDGHSCVIDREGTIYLSGTATSPLLSGLAIVSYNGDPVNQHPLYTKIKKWIRNHILNFQDANFNTTYYVIEKGNTSNGTFIPVTKINATTPNAVYSYPVSSNAQAADASSYYRIKAVNKDGSYNYSDIITDKESTNQQITKSTLSIFPNPAKDKINIQSSAAINIRLQNSLGQIILTQKIKGNGSIDVGKLPTGVYYIIDVDSGESFKVVKE